MTGRPSPPGRPRATGLATGWWRLRRRTSRQRAVVRNALEPRRRVPWPPHAARSEGGDRVAVVTVNFGTRELVSQLVYSLLRIVGPDRLASIVVVDNGSRDGSRETLQALDDAGLIRLIPNRTHRYHGPALNQALSWLARRQATVPPSQRVDYVWILDSDVVVLRRDVIADAVDTFHRTGAAIIGQTFDLRATGRSLASLNALMLDPSQVWQPRFPPFRDDGAPSDALQRAVMAAGLRLATFPFHHHSYVLHIVSGTLLRVAEGGEQANRFYEFALDSLVPRYSDHPLGPRLYRAFEGLYRGDVPDRSPAALVAACREHELHVVGGAVPLPPVEELLALRARGVELGRYLDPGSA